MKKYLTFLLVIPFLFSPFIFDTSVKKSVKLEIERSIASVDSQEGQKRHVRQMAKHSLEMLRKIERLPTGTIPLEPEVGDPIVDRYSRSKKISHISGTPNYALVTEIKKNHYTTDELPITMTISVLFEEKLVEAEVQVQTNLKNYPTLPVRLHDKEYVVEIPEDVEQTGAVNIGIKAFVFQNDGQELMLSNFESFNLSAKCWRFEEVLAEEIAPDLGIKYRLSGQSLFSGMALVEATLKDKQGHFVGMVEKIITLTEGASEIEISFSNNLLRQQKGDAPYVLDSLAVSALNEKYVPQRGDFERIDFVGQNLGSNYFVATLHSNPIVRKKLERLKKYLEN